MIDLNEIQNNNMQDFLDATGEVFSLPFAERLKKMGFFIKPAEIKHHGNIPGGLYLHSKQVAMELANITRRMNLKWQRTQSPVIIGMLHDLCKVNDYTINADDSEKGYEIYYTKEKEWTGHGESSLIMIQQDAIEHADIIITREEALCIRYHMGAFTDAKEWDFYSNAVKNNMNVLWTHAADMIAASKDI